MEKERFHSIDALRFFAFLKVYLLHIPLQGEFPIFSYLKSGGGIGVSFFFVLSGFLISYLLLFEKKLRGKVNIKNFLIRRSLRIWPLFFLIVFIVYLLPYELKQGIGMHMVGGGYNIDPWFSFTFLENYKMLIMDSFPKTTPLSVFWSLCIEEHFYIIWVITAFFLPYKRMKHFFLFSILIAIVSRWLEPMLISNVNISSNDILTNLDYFAMGGLLAWYYLKSPQAFSSFVLGFHRWVRISLVTLVVSAVVFQQHLLPFIEGSFFNLIRPSIIALLFVVLIGLMLPAKSDIRIRSKILNYLGSISYGLYVFHIFFVHVMFQYCLKHEILLDTGLKVSLFVVLSMGASILLSAFSFRYFEIPFLKLRQRLNKV